MGGSNQKPAQPSTPKNHTWGKKRVQLIVGGVAVCAALSLSGIAFAAAGGGSSVTWDAMEKEQPPVPIEQAEGRGRRAARPGRGGQEGRAGAAEGRGSG